MRKVTLISLSAAIIVLAMLVSPVLALGTVRVEPHGSYYGLSVMLTSPATFYVNITGASGNPTTDPHIFLVMTETSYNSMTGNVVVNWTDGSPQSVTVTTWNKETVNSVKVPPGADSGTGYTVALLRSHLNTTEPIYWAFEPFLNGMNLTATPIPFTVTLPATEPRMIVYVLGKADDSDLFNNRSPPTQPGFVIPEPAAIVAASMSLVALVSYAVVKRKR